jgi:hypothetical protein
MSLIAEKGRIAEQSNRRHTGFGWIHARREVLLDLTVEMELQFLIQLMLGAAAGESHSDAHPKAVKELHHSLLCGRGFQEVGRSKLPWTDRLARPCLDYLQSPL